MCGFEHFTKEDCHEFKRMLGYGAAGMAVGSAISTFVQRASVVPGAIVSGILVGTNCDAIDDDFHEL